MSIFSGWLICLIVIVRQMYVFKQSEIICFLIVKHLVKIYFKSSFFAFHFGHLVQLNYKTVWLMTVSSSMEVGATCGSTQLQSEYDVKKKENFFTVLCTLSVVEKRCKIFVFVICLQSVFEQMKRLHVFSSLLGIYHF